MIYENEIPEYALQPAREPDKESDEPMAIEKIETPMEVLAPMEVQATDDPTQSQPANAFFAPMKITGVKGGERTTITIEEDILVPDIKPDMKEILMLDGSVRLANSEIAAGESRDETVTISGDVSLQVVYVSLGNQGTQGCCLEGNLDAINTKMPFRTDWKLRTATGSLLVFDGCIEKADYIIINERKFRVKLTLCLEAREYEDCHMNLFEGLVDDEIEVRKEQVEITDLALRKKDIIAIDEILLPKDNAFIPETILKQDITMVENYKQITGEKVVINGFVYVNLLYCGIVATADMGENILTSADEKLEEITADVTRELCQYQGRVEFTEFIPINQSGPWNGSKVNFVNKGLVVCIEEDEDGRIGFRVKGDIETTVELYKNLSKEIVSDGYHRQKDFVCEFESMGVCTLVGNGMVETSVREIVNIPEHMENVSGVPYCCCNIKSSEARIEQGKCIVEGVLDGRMLCKSGSDVFTLSEEIPFRCTIDIPPAKGGEKVESRTFIKDMWADKINNKQIEFNCTVFSTAEATKESSLHLLKNPGFKEPLADQNSYAMVVSIVQPSDTLWTIAKKYKTTVADLRDLNNLEGDPAVGQKVLIVR